jgi:ribosomal protein S18 acetylase RimI-like enzyme
MHSIRKATADDACDVARIGRISVEFAHRESCSPTDMLQFLDSTYSIEAIGQELSMPQNFYHVIEQNNECAGFSKVLLNAEHDNIKGKNVMKLDRIYLLPDYFDQKLGAELFNFNLKFAVDNGQTGIWLFTWTGNKRAINFYLKAGFKIIGAHKFKVTETHYNEHHQMFLDLQDQ